MAQMVLICLAQFRSLVKVIPKSLWKDFCSMNLLVKRFICYGCSNKESSGKWLLTLYSTIIWWDCVLYNEISMVRAFHEHPLTRILAQIIPWSRDINDILKVFLRKRESGSIFNNWGHYGKYKRTRTGYYQ